MSFRKKTTFVVGAGASAEFGLPVGTGLAAEIKKSALLTDSDGSDTTQRALLGILEAKFPLIPDRHRQSQALFDIHDGIHTAVSIDAFIHRHSRDRNIEYWGKVLIALEVLKAERNSSLAAAHWDEFSSDPNALIEIGDKMLKNPDYTWIGAFFRTLSDGVLNYRDLGKDVTIICFNYDRCIEAYLAETIADAYRVHIEDALKVVETNFHIIHPYGYLGKLHVRPGARGRGRLSFGYVLSDEGEIDSIAENIHTYTEQAHDYDKVQEIHTAMSECTNLVFLGFGFNNQNLNLLRVKKAFRDVDTTKNVYATGFGLYKQIEGTLKRRIMDLFLDRDKHKFWRQDINIEFGVGCEELFKIHDMNLSSFSQSYISYDRGELQHHHVSGDD